MGNGPSTTRNGRPRRTDSQTFPLSYVSDGEVSLNVQRDSDQFPFRNEPPESTAHPGASMLPSKQMSPASSEVFPLVGNSLQDSSSFYKDGPLTPGPHVRGPFNVSNGGIPRLWTPFILRREVLIPLTCLFVLVIIVLEVLFYLSNRHLGLSTSDASKHYLWTYGPTAFLAIVAGVWGRVEYRTKQLMPWKAMTQGPTPVSKSLLLDYVSPWNVISMFKSMKASHFIVTITILGTLLMKILTVASTGLFVLQDVVLEDIPTTFVSQQKFDDNNYDGSRVDGSSVLTVAGINVLNLTFPEGTTDKYAFQTFGLPKSISSTNYQMTGFVDIFSSDLECEKATLKNSSWACTSDGCESIAISMNVTTTSCSDYYPFQGFIAGTSLTGGYFSTIKAVKCADAAHQQDPDHVVIMTTRWAAGTLAVGSAVNILEFQSLVCVPSYTITKGMVSLKSDGTLLSIVPNTTVPANSTDFQLPGVTPMDIASGLISSLGYAESIVSAAAPESPIYNATNGILFDTFIQMCNFTSPQADPAAFLQSEFLANVTRQTYKLIAAQLAKQSLTVSSGDYFNGLISASEHRLFVRSLSLRIMEGTLIALVLIAIALCKFRTSRSTSRDPGTITGLATILVRSSQLSETLANSGASSLEEINRLLAGNTYQAVVDRQGGVSKFSIEPSSKFELSTKIPNQTFAPSPIKWWNPFFVTLFARILVLVIPLALIAALEVAFQQSQSRNGLANVEEQNNDYVRYVWVYIPAMVMLGVTAIFDSFDFSAKSFHPYSVLKREGSTIQGSMTENYLSKMTIHSFCSAFVKRHYPIAATSFAMLLAPLLTITVSGLYSAEDINFARQATVQRIDTFNTTITAGTGSSDDSRNYNSHKSTPLIGSLVIDSALAYPAWTNGELVFPALSTTSLSGPNTTSSENTDSSDGEESYSIFTTTLPALRASINCTPLPSSKFNWTATIENTQPPSQWLSIELDVGTNCGSEGTVNGTFDYTSIFLSDMVNNTSFGQYRNQQDFENGGTNCPIMVSVYGKYMANSSVVSAFTCIPSVDTVNVNTTFILPDFTINSTIVDESSNKTWAENIENQLEVENFLFTHTDGTNDTYDAFYSTLLYSLQTITPEDLISAPASTIISAVDHLYRLLMAQVMNTQSRIEIPTSQLSDSNNTIIGLVVDPTLLKLKQSPISTRILEAILAMMFLCALTAFWIMDTREVLSHNPCSIAGAGSLIAGSEMLGENVPVGSEWVDDTSLIAGDLWRDVLFSLGWWGEGEERRFGVGVGRAGEEG